MVTPTDLECPDPAFSKEVGSHRGRKFEASHGLHSDENQNTPAF